MTALHRYYCFSRRCACGPSRDHHDPRPKNIVPLLEIGWNSDRVILWLLHTANDVTVCYLLVGRARQMKVGFRSFQGIIEERIGRIASTEYPECDEERFHAHCFPR